MCICVYDKINYIVFCIHSCYYTYIQVNMCAPAAKDKVLFFELFVMNGHM